MGDIERGFIFGDQGASVPFEQLAIAKTRLQKGEDPIVNLLTVVCAAREAASASQLRNPAFHLYLIGL